MNYKIKYILVSITAYLTVSCFAQEVNTTQTAKIDVKKLVKIIAQNEIYSTYRLKDYLHKNNPVVKKHKKFYIDIPSELSFENYHYKGKVSTYVFSDNFRYIVIEIHYKNDLTATKLKTDKYSDTQKNIIDTLPKQPVENIQNGLNYGIRLEAGKVLYYYNVDDEKHTLYNKSILSIRNKKRWQYQK